MLGVCILPFSMLSAIMLFIITLSVVLNVVILSVIALNVVKPNVLKLSVIVLGFVILCFIELSVIMVSVIMQSVVAPISSPTFFKNNCIFDGFVTTVSPNIFFLFVNLIAHLAAKWFEAFSSCLFNFCSLGK